jgi:hypothetical protein
VVLALATILAGVAMEAWVFLLSFGMAFTDAEGQGLGTIGDIFSVELVLLIPLGFVACAVGTRQSVGLAIACAAVMIGLAFPLDSAYASLSYFNYTTSPGSTLVCAMPGLVLLVTSLIMLGSRRRRALM